MEKVNDGKIIFHDMNGRENGPTITLTKNEERVQMLWRKLKEYTNRWNPYGAPETQTDTIYKIAVLDELLSKGSVNTWDLSRKLADLYGSVNCVDFSNACGVIQSYNDDGGKKVTGGTGLR